jgi:predicted Rossmann fold flavoprotein
MKKEVAIIGGGASGLIASIVASRRGHKVTLFEKSKKLGRKILATGNGRCNITNQNISIENYHSSQLSFVKVVLKQFGSNEAKKFFSELGLEMVEEGDKGRLYPMSLQASSVVDFLEDEINSLGVNVVLDFEVKELKKNGDRFSIDNRLFDSVLNSCGSLAMPSLGSSDSGYRLVRDFGHQIVKPFASLVQLTSEDESIKEASGVKLNASIEVIVENEIKTSVIGDLLFTNYGLSGSAILDISRVVSSAISKKQDIYLVVDLLPDLSIDSIKALLKKRQNLDKPIELLLNGLIHKKLIKIILKEANLQLEIKLNSKTINKISYAIKNLKVKVNGTKGVKSCEVMAGGIKTHDIDPKTMESKLTKGLFFSGEVLDVDGDCGGFNLHFAWASGYIAGRNI